MHTPWQALRTLVSVLGALALAPVAEAQTRPSVTLVPGTVNAGGLNGTRFVSDLALTNPSLAPVTASLSLVPANGSSTVDVSLNPGETVVYRNILDRLWIAQGAGATQVIGTGPLLARARTYNSASSGTYGVALPVYSLERLLSAGDTADSLWISQSADGSSGYRTNVAVVFPDGGGGAASVSVYDADGNLAGAQDFNLSEPGFQQFSVGSFAGAVPVGRAQIRVSAGIAAAYAVVVDNVTGDSSLFTFDDLPAGTQDVLVNGVARANGRNNTFFRTDGRFYNPGTSDATVSVAFHANQSSNPAPVSATFTIPAGKVRDVVDVLDALLGLPVGSAGALRFTSDSFVAILCRTSNVDPLGVKPGTFGAQQRPTPLLSFLMSADEGAVVTGIRQNATFRTNVGFAAGANGASWALTLKTAAGAPVATAAGSLGAFGWTQPNIQDLFPAAVIPDDATLLVRVTAGSVDVFDSSIDNASGDPVVTPIMPLPADIPSAATIGPAGGSIRSSDGRLTLKVPAGALASPADVSFATTTGDAPNGDSRAYNLAVPSEVAGKALLVLAYGASDAAGSGAEALAVAFKGGDGWYVGTGGSVDVGARTLVLPLTSLSPPGAPAARATLIAGVNLTLTLSVLRAWKIVPDRLVVRTGTTTRFSAYYTGRPSSTRLVANYFLKASDPMNVNVQWRVWGGSEFGTIAPQGTTGIYTAPCRAPAHDAGWVEYLISDNRIPFGQSPQALHSASVYILPRYWIGEIDVVGNLCGRDGGGVYTYTNATVNFALDESLNVTEIKKGPGIVPVIVRAPSCPGDSSDCSYEPGSPDALLPWSVFATDLSTSYGSPLFSLVAKYPLTPQPVKETCTGPPVRIQNLPAAGDPVEFANAISGLHAPNFNTTNHVINFFIPQGKITMRIRALPDPACP